MKYKESVSEPVGRPSIHSPADPEPVTVCSLCLASWGPGQDHVCSIQTRMNNVEELVRTANKRSRETHPQNFPSTDSMAGVCNLARIWQRKKLCHSFSNAVNLLLAVCMLVQEMADILFHIDIYLPHID